MTARRPASLDDLQVGDEVAFKPGYGSQGVYLRKVVRMTATQIATDDGKRFVRRTGREVGGSAYGAGHVNIPNEAAVIAAAETRRRNLQWHLATALKERHLSYDQLTRIRAIVEEGE